MPELPDIVLYAERLSARCAGQVLRSIRLGHPFVLRTVDPPLDSFHGARIVGVGRLGKRLVWQLDGDRYLVMHLMIAGRLKWRKAGASARARDALVVLDFDDASLVMTEASKKKRAQLHAVSGVQALALHDPGGIDVRKATIADFKRALTQQRQTLKRALTDPKTLDGIGNAYSDEILFEAGLSPMRRTDQLNDTEWDTLLGAAQQVLTTWIDRLREEVGDGFPTHVTAFREGMHVHGRFKQPCTRCRTPIQRIVRGESEMNYCPNCQTQGRILADRALSPLFRGRKR